GDLSVLSRPRKNLVWVATRARSLLESRTLALFPSVEGKLILGILLGNYALLSPEMQIAFMKSGTMHLLAASGFNCGIIVGIFGYLMYKLTIPRTVRHLLLIALLWMFAIMVGAGPSIIRATVMVSAFLAAYLLWRYPDLPNLVLFAALVILGVNPLALFDVGFQLSFTAVLAIMLVMPLVNPWIQTFFSPLIATSRTAFHPHRWILSASLCIVTAVALSMASTIGTWPITAHYFNYVSVVAVLANAITALLVVLLTGIGLTALAASVLSPVIAYPFSLVGKLLADLMLAVVMELGSHSWSCISVSSPSWVFMFLYYALVLWVLTHVSKTNGAIKGTTYAATAKY
ncbi:MAG: ComEC/Rec2 family competence protein, partial [Armatimonadota bacterium]